MEIFNPSQALSYALLKVQSRLGYKFGTIHSLSLPIHSKTWKYLFKEIFLQQIYFFESETDRPIILDCGANIGFATLYFKDLYPNAQVISFEASAETYAKLRQTVEKNHLAGVQLENVALSNESDSTVCFYKNSTDGCDLGASLTSRGVGSQEQVATKKLSDYISGRIDFMKLDIEGGETVVISELEKAGKLNLIQQGLIEFHMSEENTGNHLPTLLDTLARSGFIYRFVGCDKPDSSWKKQQVMLIGFRKKDHH